MLLQYLLLPLPNQEGMVAQPEFGHPAEHPNEVSRDDEGHRPVRPCGFRLLPKI